MSTASFALATNARQLVAGAGVAAVRRRLKLASLLHDTVMVEGGTLYVAVLTSNDSWTQIRGVKSPHGSPWQAAAARGINARRSLALDPTLETVSGYWLIPDGHDVQLYWRSSFSPFEREWYGKADWITHFGLPDEGLYLESTGPGEISNDCVGVDLLKQLWSSALMGDRQSRLREAVKGHRLDWFDEPHFSLIADDVVAASSQGWMAQADSFSLGIVTAALSTVRLPITPGARALEIIDPDDLSWSEIREIRRTKAFSDYRALLTDIELEAREAAASVSEIDSLISMRYATAIARAQAHQVSFRGRMVSVALALSVGETAGWMLGMPLVGALAGAGFEQLAETGWKLATRPRWIALDMRLRRRNYEGRFDSARK